MSSKRCNEAFMEFWYIHLPCMCTFFLAVREQWQTSVQLHPNMLLDKSLSLSLPPYLSIYNNCFLVFCNLFLQAVRKPYSESTVLHVLTTLTPPTFQLKPVISFLPSMKDVCDAYYNSTMPIKASRAKE